MTEHDRTTGTSGNLFREIDQRLREVFAQSPAADLEKNLRVLLSGFFARLDLVTREEFDVQRQVLLRTREKLAQLEAQIAELEGKLKPQERGPKP
jgi:ubiquinone biosynthesis accessory factor UbiK